MRSGPQGDRQILEVPVVRGGEDQRTPWPQGFDRALDQHSRLVKVLDDLQAHHRVECAEPRRGSLSSTPITCASTGGWFSRARRTPEGEASKAVMV